MARMDDFRVFWSQYGGWEEVRERAFRKARIAWPDKSKLSDHNIAEVIDLLGLQIFVRNVRCLGATIECPVWYLEHYSRMRLCTVWGREDRFWAAADRFEAERDSSNVRRPAVDPGDFADLDFSSDIGFDVADESALVEAVSGPVLAYLSIWEKEAPKGRVSQIVVGLVREMVEILKTAEGRRVWFSSDPDAPLKIAFVAMARLDPARWGHVPHDESVPGRHRANVLSVDIRRYVKPALLVLYTALYGDPGAEAS